MTFLLPVNIRSCVAPWQTVMHLLVFFYITSSHCYMLVQIYKGLFGFIFNVFQFTPAFPGDCCDRILRYIIAMPLCNWYFTILNHPNIKFNNKWPWSKFRVVMININKHNFCQTQHFIILLNISCFDQKLSFSGVSTQSLKSEVRNVNYFVRSHKWYKECIQLKPMTTSNRFQGMLLCTVFWLQHEYFSK
jgi:hypothetical protein